MTEYLLKALGFPQDHIHAFKYILGFYTMAPWAKALVTKSIPKTERVEEQLPQVVL